MSTRSETRRLLHGPIVSAGAPTNGTSEVQSISISGSPTGGTFRLRLGTYSIRTVAIPFNADAATVALALVALPGIGTGGITCSGGPLPGTPVSVAFAGTNAVRDMPPLTVQASLLTGGTNPAVAVSVTTPGVTATARGAPSGALLIDTAGVRLYQNEGTANAPLWVARGGNRSVEAHTAGDTLLPEESGSAHTNAGAGGVVTLVLPAAVPGRDFMFAVGAAQELRIHPAGTQSVCLPSTGVPGAGGKYLASSTPGSAVHILCLVAGVWHVVGFGGTWAAEP
ncbi:MAG TPA: hypothetical protein VHI13_15180 [Candidatus Kapabacteria bacterium]|nr:hypothetical protein [Candidatus Kapabacteria bacterium]